MILVYDGYMWFMILIYDGCVLSQPDVHDDLVKDASLTRCDTK